MRPHSLIRSGMLRLFANWLFLLCSAVFSVNGASEQIRVPNEERGPTWSLVPFGGFFVDAPPIRFQQVYDASLFPSLDAQGGFISELWFVSDDSVGREFGAYLPKVEISFSLTTREPDGLSPIFAENFNSTPVVMHPLGPLSITSGGPGFVVRMQFLTPFLYKPADGNLLVQIKNYEGAIFGEVQYNPGPLDAWDVVGDPISRVYAFGDADATTGIADTLGLTTYFVVTPIPEPSMLALLGLFLCVLCCWFRRTHHNS